MEPKAENQTHPNANLEVLTRLPLAQIAEAFAAGLRQIPPEFREKACMASTVAADVVLRETCPSPEPTAAALAKQTEAILLHLRSLTLPDCDRLGTAWLVAAAMVFRERFGEERVVSLLRSIEGNVSQAAALDRWPVEGITRH